MQKGGKMTTYLPYGGTPYGWHSDPLIAGTADCPYMQKEPEEKQEQGEENASLKTDEKLD